MAHDDGTNYVSAGGYPARILDGIYGNSTAPITGGVATGKVSNNVEFSLQIGGSPPLLTISPQGEVSAPNLESANEAGRVFVQSIRNYFTPYADRESVAQSIHTWLEAYHDHLPDDGIKMLQDLAEKISADLPQNYFTSPGDFYRLSAELRSALLIAWTILDSPVSRTRLGLSDTDGRLKVIQQALNTDPDMVSRFGQPETVRTLLVENERLRQLFKNPPGHKYWTPGDPDCPKELKVSNGELHTLRCKVCGEDSPRNKICLAAVSEPTETESLPSLAESVLNGTWQNILIWLGAYRDNLSDDAIKALQEIANNARNVVFASADNHELAT